MWAGFERADPIVGLLIAIAILAVLRGAAKQIYHRLMDAVDPSIVDEIDRVAADVPGVHSVSSTRVRWLGHRLTADLTIEVDPNATVADGHRLASATERRLVERVRHLDEFHVHVHDRPDSSGESESPHPIEARPD